MTAQASGRRELAGPAAPPDAPSPQRPTAGRSPAAARPRPALRAVALPAEHGGWSLTAEPVALGLLVSWSWPGLALGVAAMVAFVARTPLKVVLVDRWRHRWLPRTRLALAVAATEVAVLAALVAAAAAGAERPFWVPLALAAPLVAVELWFDMRSRSRRAVPELSGAVGIGSVAAAIALAGGTDGGLAAGLWAVVAARSVAAIPYVRTQLARGRHHAGPRWPSDLAQAAAVAAVAVAWAAGALPFAPVVAMAVLAAVNVAAVRLPPRPAVVIGIQQAVYGLGITVVTAVAVHLAP
jgi:hypothetical protein